VRPMASLGHDSAAPLRYSEPWQRRGSARPAVRAVALRLPVWVWIALIVTGSTFLRIVSGVQTAAPWIFPDELIYSELARSFANVGHFQVSGEPFSAYAYGPLYPILIAPFYRFAANPAEAYAWVKAFDAFLISTAAIPAYLIAGRFLKRNLALLGAGATVLLASTVYASKLMTESLALPVFMWTVLAIVHAVERPRPRRTALALLLIAVAVLTRAQMIALLPTLVSARLLFPRLTRAGSPKRIRSGNRAWVAAVSIIGVVVLSSAAVSTGLLGNRGGVLDRLHPAEAPKWLVYHLAELDLAVGVMPLGAFVLLAILVFRRKLPSASTQLAAFLAVSASALVWLLVLVAVYASQRKDVPLLYERYLMYVEPLLIFGFLAWLQHSAPRPKRLTVAIAVAAGTLPALIPFHALITHRTWGVNSATPGLVPWALLSHAFGTGAGLTAAVLVIACMAASSFARSRPDRAGILILIVLGWIASSRMLVDLANVKVASNVRPYTFGTRQTDWLDKAVGPHADVVAVWAGAGAADDRSPYALWQTMFWNNSVRHAYRLNEPSRAELAEPKLVVRSRQLMRNGKPLSARYVLIDRSVPVDGKLVAGAGDLGLFRVDGPVTLRPTGS
jgi:hypothetical protein